MDPLPEELELRDEMAADTLEMVRRDGRAVPAKLKPLFKYLEDHLFDSGLTAGSWMRDCEIYSNTVYGLFSKHLGLTPKKYLHVMRINTAAGLLEAGLEPLRAGELVGYPIHESFCKNFDGLKGASPAVYRKQHAGVDGQGKRYRRELARMVEWRLAQVGLGDAQARAEELVELYPDVLDAHECQTDHLTEKDWEGFTAQRLWEKIRDRPFTEQAMLVRLQCFTTSALFELLKAKSLEEGRKDRRGGVEIARLGLVSVEVVAQELGEELPNLKADAWVNIAHTLWLAEDFGGAESAFSHAEFELTQAGDRCDPYVQAQFFSRKSAMRWYQRRYDEALGLVAKAIPVLENLGNTTALAEALLVRAGILDNSGKAENAIPGFQRAIALLDEDKEARLSCSGLTGLSSAFRRIGKNKEAAEALFRAEAISDRLADRVAVLQISWSAALVRQADGLIEEAEQGLHVVRIGFRSEGKLGYLSLVLLDLARLYSEAKRPRDAIKAAAEALPMLEALVLKEEADTAFRLLWDASTPHSLGTRAEP